MDKGVSSCWSASEQRLARTVAYGIIRWPRGTVFSELPSTVTSTVDHPLGSPSLLDINLLDTVYPSIGQRGTNLFHVLLLGLLGRLGLLRGRVALSLLLLLRRRRLARALARLAALVLGLQPPNAPSDRNTERKERRTQSLQ
jgi:hypothetical protein